MRVSMRVRSVDVGPADRKAAGLARRVRAVVTIAAREDTRPYVPYLTGDLDRSVMASRPEDGKLIWDTSYARAQYYGLPNKTKSPHTRATMQWFEHSKAVNQRRWERAAKAETARVFPGR
jgi:hypothetical protein